MTINCAVCVTAPYEAEIRTVVEVDTVPVATVNAALVELAETVTLAGTDAIAALLLESETTAPAEPAGALIVTVPCKELPPAMLVGINETDVREVATPAVRSRSAVFFTPP